MSKMGQDPIGNNIKIPQNTQKKFIFADPIRSSEGRVSTHLGLDGSIVTQTVTEREREERERE